VKFRAHNIASATPAHIEKFLSLISTRVLTIARDGSEMRAVKTIMASTAEQVALPLMVIRLRKPVTVGNAAFKHLYPPGSLAVLGLGSLAVEIPDGEDAENAAI